MSSLSDFLQSTYFESHLLCFQFGAIVKKLLWTFVYRVFSDGHHLSHLLGKYLGVERLGHVVGVFLTSKETAKLFSKVAMPCLILPAEFECSISSVLSPTLGISVFLS